MEFLYKTASSTDFNMEYPMPAVPPLDGGRLPPGSSGNIRFIACRGN
jgi:hypothetical protein